MKRRFHNSQNCEEDAKSSVKYPKFDWSNEEKMNQSSYFSGVSDKIKSLRRYKKEVFNEIVA
jgi:hypothetical protein